MSSRHLTPVPMQGNILAALAMVLEDLPVVAPLDLATRQRQTSLRLAQQVIQAFPAGLQDPALEQLRQLVAALTEAPGARSVADASAVASAFLTTAPDASTSHP